MRFTEKQKNEKIKEYYKVRELYSGSRVSTRTLANMFGKSQTWVWNVIKGEGFPAIDELNLPNLIVEGKKIAQLKTNNYERKNYKEGKDNSKKHL